MKAGAVAAPVEPSWTPAGGSSLFFLGATLVSCRLCALSPRNRSPYSAATCDAAMNCDTHFFRRLRFSRYIASNSAGGKECVDGRLSSAAPQALSRGNVSIWPSFFTPSKKK